MCEVISFGRHRSICCLWVRLFVCFASRFFFFISLLKFSVVYLWSHLLFSMVSLSIHCSTVFLLLYRSFTRSLSLSHSLHVLSVYRCFFFASNKYKQNAIASFLCDYVYVWNDQTQAWPRQITSTQSCDKQTIAMHSTHFEKCNQKYEHIQEQ